MVGPILLEVILCGLTPRVKRGPKGDTNPRSTGGLMPESMLDDVFQIKILNPSVVY